jgi:hypothetical protein
MSDSLLDSLSKKRKVEQVSISSELIVDNNNELESKSTTTVSQTTIVESTIDSSLNNDNRINDRYIPLSLRVGSVSSSDEEIFYLLKQLEYLRQEKEEAVERLTSYATTIESMLRSTIDALDDFDSKENDDNDDVEKTNDKDNNNENENDLENNSKNDEEKNENSNESIKDDDDNEKAKNNDENDSDKNDDNNDDDDDETKSNSNSNENNDIEHKLDDYFNIGDDDDDSEDDDDFQIEKKKNNDDDGNNSNNDDDSSSSSSSSSEMVYQSVGQIADRSRFMLELVKRQMSSLPPCFPKPIRRCLQKPVHFMFFIIINYVVEY